MNERRLFRALAVGIVSIGALIPAVAQEPVRFTVTADARFEHAGFDEVLNAINSLSGGPGSFHVSPGDMDDRIWENRALIDDRFGPAAIWIPGTGNHEAEDPVEMEWIRAEFDTGQGVRVPLAELVTRPGPDGSRETTFSWDLGNAHFVHLNEYWDGTTDPGGDTATDGDVVPELRAWLAADLAANTRPAVFVFGHEPAFPRHRHLDDSLNKYEVNRDAFWDLLEAEDVVAYICGHTHVFSTFVRDGGRVTQIDVGNAGNDSSWLDGQTFLAVEVANTEVEFRVCRNQEGPFECLLSWTQPIRVIFKDGFESGDLVRWDGGLDR